MSASDWAAWVQAIGSILAVGGAACIAVWQQRQNILSENERRERKNSAARALLPATLAELSEYTNNCFDLLIAYRDSDLPGERRKTFICPKLPLGSMKEIKECIEFADKEPQKRMSKLLEMLQIQN